MQAKLMYVGQQDANNGGFVQDQKYVEGDTSRLQYTYSMSWYNQYIHCQKEKGETQKGNNGKCIYTEFFLQLYTYKRQ